MIKKYIAAFSYFIPQRNKSKTRKGLSVHQLMAYVYSLRKAFCFYIFT